MKREYKSSIFRSLIYVLEILIVVGGITFLSLIYFPVSGFDIVERFIVFLTIYQLSIYSFIKLYDAAKKDSLNTLRNYCEIALLAIKNDDYGNNVTNHYFQIISRQIQVITGENVLNTEEVLQYYKQLLNALDKKDSFSIELIILNINHSINMADLEFNQSLFIRLMFSLPNSSVENYKNEHN